MKMKTLATLALAAALLFARAEAKTKKTKKVQKKHVADGDQPVTRYDVAEFVARALDILRRSRGGELVLERGSVDDQRSLTNEMHGEAADLSDRIGRLTNNEQSLHEDIQKLLKDRHR